MRTHWPIISLFIFALSGTASAVDLAAVGGFNHDHASMIPDPPATTDISAQAAFDLGVLAAFPLGGDYLFDTGLIRHRRKILTVTPSSSLSTEYNAWLIPLNVRFMRAPFFGFGFGPYLALLESDSIRKSLDIGLRASLRIALPVYGQLRAILDGSYLFGVTDLTKSATTQSKTQELLVLFGLEFPFQFTRSPNDSKDTAP